MAPLMEPNKWARTSGSILWLNKWSHMNRIVRVGAFDDSIDGAIPILLIWGIHPMDPPKVKKMDPLMGSIKESHQWVHQSFIKVPH